MISSLPLRTLAGIAEPRAPADVLEAAAGLRYRDFITVALVIDGEDLFPDNWIYVHDPDVAGRPDPELPRLEPRPGPRPDRTCLGLEYFCFEGDELWTAADDELVERPAPSSRRSGSRARDAVVTGHVVRVPKAYPIYDAGYEERVARCAAGSTASRTSCRSVATACTATTTPTTRC